MLFTPEKYSIPDQKFLPFMDSAEVERILSDHATPSTAQIESAIECALSYKRLSLAQTAVLLNAKGKDHLDLLFKAARQLKEKIYGDRIVLFAPLYIGNKCVNNCGYCGFRSSNTEAVRKTLRKNEIKQASLKLEKEGQKRLILVFGEHKSYDAEFISDTVSLVYKTNNDRDKINRVNINAAPFDIEGFKSIKLAGIGTYQIFQETYHPKTYSKFHPSGPKADYDYRLTAMDRAMEAGIDDVGLGVLFGLHDWRFEVMSLVRHVNHLEACFGVGPHTISFPRIQKASNTDDIEVNSVADEDFKKIIAILRLAVPYTGLILTAREPSQLRDELLEYGVTQIDAGTRLEIGGYTQQTDIQDLEKEQFLLNDTRSLEETINELISQGNVPSFCTACYRRGRTGEHFMQFSTKGFIKKFCTPNALLTFAEYLQDYASEKTREKGILLINEKIRAMNDPECSKINSLLERVLRGERDILI